MQKKDRIRQLYDVIVKTRIQQYFQRVFPYTDPGEILEMFLNEEELSFVDA